MLHYNEHVMASEVVLPTVVAQHDVPIELFSNFGKDVDRFDRRIEVCEREPLRLGNRCQRTALTRREV
jgi:hypothetical protein